MACSYCSNPHYCGTKCPTCGARVNTPAAPVELEPVAYMAQSGTCVSAEDVSYTPNWTDYYTTALVRQSDAAAVIAAKDAEIERLKEERLGVISQSKMHPSWLEKSRGEILDCLRFQGRTTAVLLVETADLRKQLSAAEKDAAQMQADFNAAINHAIEQRLDAADFLRCWREGDWEGCKEWGFEVSDALRNGYVKGEEA